jgi:prolipoprotein diacylglyceryltransferase
MFPYFYLFGRAIGMYQIMVLAGIFAAGIYACHACRRDKFDENEAIIFLLVCAIGVLFGGHILYGIINFHEIEYILKDAHSDYGSLFSRSLRIGLGA